jgi:uncharacterized membrane protein YphA (DoxX/SURF4 family)
MNVVLWIIQILLAVMFIMVGGLKLVVSREQLLASGVESGRQNMAWAEDFSPTNVRFIGLLEALGGIGLILPALTGVLPVLTPLAALGLCIVMVGAVVVHLRRKESALTRGPLMLAVLAAVVAVGRLIVVPF